MKKIQVILIDDERLAREELRRMLDAYPDLEIVAEAANADEAAKLIEKHQPDLILLDIQMPGKSGFDLLEMLPQVPEGASRDAAWRVPCRRLERSETIRSIAALPARER